MQENAKKFESRGLVERSQWTVHLVGLVLLITLVLAPVSTRAQIAGAANIQGTVTDSTGAVVSSAPRY